MLRPRLAAAFVCSWAGGSGRDDGGGTTTGPATGDDTGGPNFDVSTALNLGQPEVPGTISTTCAAAERFETTVGCLFYAVDLSDNYTPWDDTDWGVVTDMHGTGSYADVGGLSTAVINPTPPEG